MKSIQTSRYEQRVRGKELLKKLNIVDVNKTPQSVASHNLLTRNSNSVDIIGKSAAAQKLMQNSSSLGGYYAKREQAQKIDLELTCLQVLQTERGRG